MQSNRSFFGRVEYPYQYQRKAASVGHVSGQFRLQCIACLVGEIARTPLAGGLRLLHA